MADSEIQSSSSPARDSTERENLPDPWEDTETAHLREFLKLTYTERFHLLMQAIEFMRMLRPIENEERNASE